MGGVRTFAAALVLLTLAAADHLEWAVTVASSADDQCTSAALLDSGDVVVMGWFGADCATFSGDGTELCGGPGVFVARLAAADGHVVFARTLDGALTGHRGSVAVDEHEHVFVAGTFADQLSFVEGFTTTVVSSRGESDLFYLELTDAGALLFAVGAGGEGAEAFADAAPAGDERVWLAGSFESELVLPTGQTLVSMGGADVVLALLDSNAVERVVAAQSQSGADEAFAAGTDAATGDCFLAMGTSPSEPLYFSEGTSLAPLDDDDDDDTGGVAAVVARVSADSGDVLWAVHLGLVPAHIELHVEQDPTTGDVVVLGSFEREVLGLEAPGQQALFRASLDAADGALLDAAVIGCEGGAVGNGELSASAPDGGSFLSGWFRGCDLDGLVLEGREDVFVQKLAPDGSPLWALAFAGDAFDVSTDVAANADGDLAVAGYFNSSELAGVPRVGGTDCFAARVSGANAPAVLAEPEAETTVDPGADVELSVWATANPVPAYQWQLDGEAISGATSATLALAGVAEADEGSYACLVSNDLGEVLSAAAALVVNDLPAITAQPEPVTVDPMDAAVLAVAAEGTGALSYLWYRDGEPTEHTGAEVEFFFAVEADEGDYHVVVSSYLGEATSNTVRLSVNDPPVIVGQPAAVLGADPGAAVTLALEVTGTEPLAYAWTLNGAALADSDGPELAIAAMARAHEGVYQCTVSNSAGADEAADMALYMNEPPTISRQPEAQTTVDPGADVELSVAAEGSGDVWYQWRLDGAALSGATSATLALAGVAEADEGNYTVLVSDSAGDTLSAAAALSVNDPPVIVADLADVTVRPGDELRLSLAVTGTAPLAFAWSTGAVTAEPELVVAAHAADADEGAYSVTVSNSAGAAASREALVEVEDAPAITVQPASVTADVGDSAAFAVEATTTNTALAYQWYHDGDALATAAGRQATLVVDDVSAADKGLYQCAVSNDAGTTVSDAASLSFPPAALLVEVQPGGAEQGGVLGAHPVVRAVDRDLDPSQAESYTVTASLERDGETLVADWGFAETDADGRATFADLAVAAALTDPGAGYAARFAVVDWPVSAVSAEFVIWYAGALPSCAAAVWDAEGSCCSSSSSGVDACGVCGGDGDSCALRVEFSADDGAAADAFGDALAAATNVSASRVSVSVSVAPSAFRRRRLGSDDVSGAAVVAPGPGMAALAATVQEQWLDAGSALRQLAGSGVDFSGSPLVTRAGDCGNALCESGEDAQLCAADCSRANEPPASDGGALSTAGLVLLVAGGGFAALLFLLFVVVRPVVRAFASHGSVHRKFVRLQRNQREESELQLRIIERSGQRLRLALQGQGQEPASGSSSSESSANAAHAVAGHLMEEEHHSEWEYMQALQQSRGGGVAGAGGDEGRQRASV